MDDYLPEALELVLVLWLVLLLALVPMLELGSLHVQSLEPVLVLGLVQGRVLWQEFVSVLLGLAKELVLGCVLFWLGFAQEPGLVEALVRAIALLLSEGPELLVAEQVPVLEPGVRWLEQVCELYLSELYLPAGCYLPDLMMFGYEALADS